MKRDFKLYIIVSIFSFVWPFIGVSGFLPTGSRIIDAKSHYYLKRQHTRKTSLNEYQGLIEKQLELCEGALTIIEQLQSEVLAANSTDALELGQDRLEILEKYVEDILRQPLPPKGLTSEEYVDAIRAYLKLPLVVQLAFIKALDLDVEKSKDPFEIPSIVSRLYEEKATLTPKKLSDAMKFASSGKPLRASSKTEEGKSESKDATSLLTSLLEKEVNEEKNESALLEGFLPRVTRKEKAKATSKDLEILMNALKDKSVFISSGFPVDIPGGYLLRGEGRKSSASELLESLDTKLPKNWDCTVSYIPDFTREETNKGNSLVLLKKDFSPSTNPWVYRLTTATAFVTALLFSVGVYGSNDAVLDQLTEAATLGDYSKLDWFNGKVLDILFPLFIILASHEIGHVFVAKSENIETKAPSILPFFVSLPVFGVVTRIASSPRNLTALFDFAFIGPLLGFVSSIVFLGTGLLATKSALEGDGSAAQFLPALPSSVLHLSTFGASVIDNFFGAEGQIIAQDGNTAIPLHPYAIAGYCGLLINAAEMLPLGATDGGRLSLTVFGRQGHVIIGGFAWFALLVASFTLPENQNDFILTAWAFNNVVQNDQEVPCRDETENINLPRSFALFGMWFLAVLILVPIN